MKFTSLVLALALTLVAAPVMAGGPGYEDVYLMGHGARPAYNVPVANYYQQQNQGRGYLPAPAPSAYSYTQTSVQFQYQTQWTQPQTFVPSSMNYAPTQYALSGVQDFRNWQNDFRQYTQRYQGQIQVQPYRCPPPTYQPTYQPTYRPPTYYPPTQYQPTGHLNQYDAAYYGDKFNYQLESQRMSQDYQIQKDYNQLAREQMEYERNQYNRERKLQSQVAVASMFGQMLPMFVIAASGR